MIGVKKNKQAIVWKIEGLSESVKELKMLVNPNNISLAMNPIVNETRTLGGFVQEYWGEQMTSLTASGQTAMFYNSDGLTNKNVRDTEAYNEFIKLVNIYKNNGKDYYTPSSNKGYISNPNRIKSFGSVVMVYMDKVYYGYFESFTIQETAEKPFNFDYSISFKITRTIGDYIVKSGRFIKEQS